MPHKVQDRIHGSIVYKYKDDLFVSSDKSSPYRDKHIL